MVKPVMDVNNNIEIVAVAIDKITITG